MMEKHGVTDNEGEVPDPKNKEAQDKQAAEKPARSCGDDPLSKMADAVKDQSAKK